jgi:hypothetical protein
LAYKGYTPEYERLADAVRQVVAAGATKAKARRDICVAIGDGAIEMRLTLDKSEDYYGSPRVPPGEVLLPRPFLPEYLDWEGSRPREKGLLDKWPLGPVRADGTVRKMAKIALIELRGADVLKVLCEGGKEDTVPSITKLSRSSRVSKQQVEALLTQYRDSLARAPPSIKAFEALARSRGLSGHREQLRQAYRKEFPNYRVGRPKASA